MSEFYFTGGKNLGIPFFSLPVSMRALCTRSLWVDSVRRRFKTFIGGVLQLFCRTRLKSFQLCSIVTLLRVNDFDLSLFPRHLHLNLSKMHWLLIFDRIQKNSWRTPLSFFFVVVVVVLSLTFLIYFPHKHSFDSLSERRTMIAPEFLLCLFFRRLVTAL